MIVSGCATYLIHHIDEGLLVVPEEAADRITFILTREDHLHQGGEFMWGKCASGQTSAG